MYSFLKKIDKLAIFFMAYTLGFLLFFGTLNFTLPFVLAILFALILKTPTRFLSKKLRIKGWVASLLTTTIFFISIIAVISLLIFALTLESIDIASDLKFFISDNSDSLSIALQKINEIQNSLNINLDFEFLTEHLNNIVSSILDFAGFSLQYLFKIISYIPFILSTTFCIIIATYFFTKNFIQTKNKNKRLLYSYPKFLDILQNIKSLFTDYIVAYLFIILISSTLNFIIFSVFNIKYALTLAILAGFFDILPLLGTAVIYLPLILFYFFTGNTTLAMLLSISFILLCVVRELFEHKILSSSLGITPLESLICIFVGIELNGLLGVIFCLFFVVGYKLFLKTEKSMSY